MTFIKILVYKYTLDYMWYCAKPFRIDTCLHYISSRDASAFRTDALYENV